MGLPGGSKRFLFVEKVTNERYEKYADIIVMENGESIEDTVRAVKEEINVEEIKLCLKCIVYQTTPYSKKWCKRSYIKIGGRT